MPTEELFGAYNFLLEVAGDAPKDSFDFTAAPETRDAAMILPAVQRIPTEVLEEATSGKGDHDGGVSHLDGRGDNQAADSGHDEWIDVLSIDWGAGQPSGAVKAANLRSDGDLVQAVGEADMGGDFIL